MFASVSMRYRQVAISSALRFQKYQYFAARRRIGSSAGQEMCFAMKSHDGAVNVVSDGITRNGWRDLVQPRIEANIPPPPAPGGILRIDGHAPCRDAVGPHFFVADVQAQPLEQLRRKLGSTLFRTPSPAIACGSRSSVPPSQKIMARRAMCRSCATLSYQ